MPETDQVPVADLLLDPGNARLREETPSQQATALALTKQQGAKLVTLAAHIVQHGLDPSSLICVVPTKDQKKRYRVLEGNRRVLALLALETPSLIAGALDAPSQARLNRLAQQYSKNPIDTVTCVLFEDEAAANLWITLRHTGENRGVGIVAWGAEERERFEARHGAHAPVLKVIDFLDKHGTFSAAAQQSQIPILTNLERLLKTSEFRDAVGLVRTGGDFHSRFPAEEVAKSLSHVVEDLKTGRLKVSDIYTSEQRRDYAARLPESVLPNSKKALPTAVPVADLTAGATTVTRAARRPRRRAARTERTALIPRECQLNIDPSRINSIYNELTRLSVEQYPNACSVLLRVFLELSVDHYAIAQSVLTDQQVRTDPLAKRLKVVAQHLAGNGKISAQLKVAMERVADGARWLAASTPTFNLFVHNQYVFPKPSELRMAWDELQPFMEKLWA
jgi:hypothetical protein